MHRRGRKAGQPDIQLLVKIQEAQRVELTNEIESALASGDAARAGDAIAQYRSVPGAILRRRRNGPGAYGE